MNTSEQINLVVDNFAGKLEPVLTELANSLGSSVEYLFEIGTRHMIAGGVAGLIISLSLIFLIVFLNILIYQKQREGDKIECMLIMCTLSVIPMVPLLIIVYFSILKLISPEYSFILSILDRL